MPLGRRFAAISTALVTAAAGLIAAPSAQAASVTFTPPAGSCTSSGPTEWVLPSFLDVGDDLNITGVNDCNQADIVASGFAGGATKISGNSTTTLTGRLAAAGAGAVLATITKSGTGSNPNIVITVKNATAAWSAKSPPDGTVGAVYNSPGYQFDAPNGSGDYSVASGSLPAGLSLSPGGLLSGTPTQPGSFTFEVARVGESETTGNLTVTIAGAEITKVTICHRTRATTNPYVLITVSVSSVIGSGGRNGHADHNTTRTNTTDPTNDTNNGSGPFDTSFPYPSNKKWWGDIIPPFSYDDNGVTRTYAGLNWASDWDTPNPTPGTANWLEDGEFASAIRDAAGVDTNSRHYRAAAECLNLATGQQSAKSAEMDTPQKYFNVSVRNGEDPESIREDLVEQEAEAMGGGAGGGSPITIDPIGTLETSYATTAAVTTDAVSGTGRTSTTLKGTLKSPTAWTSWKFEWSTAPEGVAGSSNNFNSTSIPSANNSGDFEVDREVTGLTCATQYYYRVTGNTNQIGLIRSFTTSACQGNSGGGNSGGGNGNSGGNSGNTPGTGSTTPPGQTPTVGGGRPPRLTLPPAGPTNRPVTPGNSSTPGNSNSNTPGNGDDEDSTSTPGTTGTNGPGSPSNPLNTVYRPRNLTPTTSVPAPPGTEWEPTQTRIQDPATGEPVLRVTNEAGTWTVNERSGAITYTPAVGYSGSATVNVVLVARSGEIYIHPMRVPIAFTSRVKVISGDVPRDISGGVARIIRPWQR